MSPRASAEKFPGRANRKKIGK